MIDPFTAFAAAQTAVSAIKKGIQLGKDIGGISNDLAKFAGAVSDLNFAHKSAENKPWYAVLFGDTGPSAMDIFAKKLSSIFSLGMVTVLGKNFSILKRKFVKTVRLLCIVKRRLSRRLLSGLWAVWWYYLRLVYLLLEFTTWVRQKVSGKT